MPAGTERARRDRRPPDVRRSPSHSPSRAGPSRCASAPALGSPAPWQGPRWSSCSATPTSRCTAPSARAAAACATRRGWSRWRGEVSPWHDGPGGQRRGRRSGRRQRFDPIALGGGGQRGFVHWVGRENRQSLLPSRAEQRDADHGGRAERGGGGGILDEVKLRVDRSPVVGTFISDETQATR